MDFGRFTIKPANSSASAIVKSLIYISLLIYLVSTHIFIVKTYNGKLKHLDVPYYTKLTRPLF